MYKINIDLPPRLSGIFGDTSDVPKIKVHPDAKLFEIAGQEGAKGLRVAVNPGGEMLLWPVDPMVGRGFALHVTAAHELALILAATLPQEPFALAVPGGES